MSDWGDRDYIAAIFGWARQKYNRNHDPDNGQFTSGDGGSSGGGDLPPKVPRPDGPKTTWYHGTSNQQRTLGGDVVYLTDSEDEAFQYARDIHRFGQPAGTQRRTLYMTVNPGKTLNLDRKIQEAMERGIDPDEYIKSQIPKARKQGYRYIFFTHPSNIPGNDKDQNVLVALNPKEDVAVQ